MVSAAVKKATDALFECSRVFWANYNSKKKVNVNQGGTWSTKTYSVVQCMYRHALEDPECVCTITTEDIPALKKGAYRDAETIYKNSPYLQSQTVSWNKTDRIITFRNGSIIEFTSNDSVIDAQQGKRDYLFVNEANSIDYQIYFQLAIRTRKKIYLDYNPSAPFWVHDKMIGLEAVAFFISDHRHNPFISESMHREVEGIQDADLWKVYARGATGNLEGIIYTNWQLCEDALFHEMCNSHDKLFFGGLDIGYTNDPTVGVKMFRKQDSLYIHEMFYQKGGIPMVEIDEHLRSNGWQSNRQTLYCDTDPNVVNALRRLNIRAMPARKDQGSIIAGIHKVKEFKVFVTRSSVNIWNERKRYVWLTDPKTGKPINEPIDKWNHAMDALRYGAYTHFYREA